ncbi:MAG: DNA topoisomerase I [Candidatus Aenigmarchaeota archaeon]|nr:DNA topoisomerase I [Candidatus Aenigmarchaeota archaeon]
MSYTLIIAEKPDASRRIAESIADERPVIVRKNGVDYYEFTVDGKKHVCVPAVGHLFVLSPKEKYPIFDFDWIPTYEKKGTEWTEKYFKNIKSLAKGADEFIDAADVDNEGETLLYNILRFICGVEDAKRMKFSTLTKDELVESYRTMDEHIMFPLAEMGLTRHYLDALWGLNVSTALMNALKTSKKGFVILSTGRVQGPTLNMLMERELEIRNFKPVLYWQLELHFDIDGNEFIANYERDKLWEKSEAEKILSECKDKDAVVKNILKKQYKQNPLPPFNTTSLQAEAYAQFKFSPTQTLSIAEGLYQAGYISYPRSSSEKLPPSIGYQKILDAIGRLSPYKKFVDVLLKKKLQPIEGSRTDPAHPAIYATHEIPNLKKLNVYEKKIYDLIVRRTLSAFADAATRETNTVSLDVDGNRFVIVGKRTVESGWTSIYEPYVSKDELILPELKIGQKLDVKKLQMLSKETKPPGRYSQGSILKELEDRNLGTKATRAEILQTLYDRGYVVGKSIQVTKLGEAVAKSLKEYCPDIVSEELTRHFDEETDNIFDGKKNREKVVEEAKDVVKGILGKLEKNEVSIGEMLGEGLIEARKVANKIGECPNCKIGELKIIYSKKTGKKFVGCSNYPNCKTAFPLPGYGLIIPLNKSCEDCSMPMIQVVRKGRRPFKMCVNPKCKSKENWGKKASR